jgi:membrane-bound lytic murein transglycosylase D
MHKNAKDYGLEDIEIDEPIDYENIEVEAATHLALIADAADRPVSEIRELNPALMTNVAPAGLTVHIPTGTRTQVLATLTTIPAQKRASWRIHRVADGDTLDSIAQKYRMPVGAIAAANNAADADVGDVLIIPTASQLERTSKASAQKPASKGSEKTSTRSRAGSSSTSSKNTGSRGAQHRVTRRGVHTAGLR